MWALGARFEPQYSLARIFFSKFVAIIALIDDIYDAYGTFEELIIITEAIQRWSITCLDMLPEYMKPIYKLLMDTYSEMEENLANKGKTDVFNCGKESENKLSTICERVFDRCLAPSTSIGEGCDNMTMILVQFKKPIE
nr:amorpha-4,11-diene synthase [Tanacetum cinerariifolium]